MIRTERAGTPRRLWIAIPFHPSVAISAGHLLLDEGPAIRDPLIQIHLHAGALIKANPYPLLDMSILDALPLLESEQFAHLTLDRFDLVLYGASTLEYALLSFMALGVEGWVGYPVTILG